MISIRRIVMDQLKSHLKGFEVWKQIEARLAIICSDLEEPTTEQKKRQVIKHLDRIHDYLIEQGIEPDKLDFLTDEIKRYRLTRQISLYVEKDDYIEPEIIEKYSRLSYGSEGVMGIHLPYTFEQVKKLTNGVYNHTGLIKFYISPEITLHGKIIAEVWERSQNIPIAKLIESNKIDKETGEPLVKKILLFGERFKPNQYTLIKEIEIPFYIYRFISEDNNEYFILTHEQCAIGDYVLTGMVTQLDDYKNITENSKLPTKLPYLFVHNIKNRILQFKSNEELMTRAKYLKFNRTNLWDIPFTAYDKDKQYVLEHPEWFKWLVWSWLTHKAQGLNPYPLNLMMVGPAGSGKSSLLNMLHARSNESRDIFSGVGSTMKGLVPSFKYNPPNMGYLAECNRYSFCDEFLRCMINLRGGVDQREEEVGKLNDLLEHQKRSVGSGVSKINIKMTSRIFASTNPVRNLSNMSNMLKSLDNSFLSRWLIYFQNDEHVESVKSDEDNPLKEHAFRVSNSNWISMMDYLNTIDSVYDKKRVRDIYKSAMSALSEDLQTHYTTRHKHHISCMMDGIIKTRCLLDNNPKFVAIDKDYEVLSMVWGNIIRSWIDPSQVSELPVDQRINYLPEICQRLYWVIKDEDRPLDRHEVFELGKKVMSKGEVTNALVLLVEHELLVEKDNMVELYRWSK